MISNQCLRIPPSHPLAKEYYDLQCAQSTVIHHMSPSSPAYDPAKVVEMAKALAVIDEALRFLQTQYRAECGADDSCTVSLTIGPNGYPIVDGRPSDGMPYIRESAGPPPIRH